MTKQERSNAQQNAISVKRRHVPLDVEHAIKRLALKNCKPTAIFEYLNNDSKYQGRLPSLRTVQTIVKEATTLDKSEPWSLADAEGPEAKSVLGVLAAVIVATDGRVIALTKSEAEWVDIICQAAPDLPALDIYCLAKTYLKRQETKAATNDLDSYIAFAPWRDNFKRHRLYQRAVDKGHVPKVPISVCNAVYSKCLSEEILHWLLGDEYPLLDESELEEEWRLAEEQWRLNETQEEVSRNG